MATALPDLLAKFTYWISYALSYTGLPQQVDIPAKFTNWISYALSYTGLPQQVDIPAQFMSYVEDNFAGWRDFHYYLVDGSLVVVSSSYAKVWCVLEERDNGTIVPCENISADYDDSKRCWYIPELASATEE